MHINTNDRQLFCTCENTTPVKVKINEEYGKIKRCFVGVHTFSTYVYVNNYILKLSTIGKHDSAVGVYQGSMVFTVRRDKL